MAILKMLGALIILSIVYGINILLNFKKREYLKKGYSCIELNSQHQITIPIILFVSAAALFISAIDNGNITDLEQFALIGSVTLAILGAIHIYTSKLTRIFYNTNGLLKERRFSSKPIIIEKNEILHITLDLTSYYNGKLTIETMSNGIFKYINSDYSGIAVFAKFASTHFASKLEVITKDSLKENQSKNEKQYINLKKH